MEAGQLWKEEVQELHDKEYKDVELSHMLANNFSHTCFYKKQIRH